MTKLSVKICGALNKCFKAVEHPFNTGNAAVMNYAEFEYQSAETVFGLYDGLGNVREIITNNKVLDVGCGGGGKDVYLVEMGAHSVCGVDINEFFLEQARRFAKEKNVIEQCHFFREDSTALHFADESFDVVILNDVMEHFANPAGSLREILRVLKVGGYFLINFEPYGNPWGGHLRDKLNIPWGHLCFKEKTRIALYKKLIRGLADEDFRKHYCLSGTDGEESLDYLNHMTIANFNKLLKSYLAKEQIVIKGRKYISFSKLGGEVLARVPVVKELFTKNIVVIGVKKSNEVNCD